jgi:hypothetical protein
VVTSSHESGSALIGCAIDLDLCAYSRSCRPNVFLRWQGRKAVLLPLEDNLDPSDTTKARIYSDSLNEDSNLLFPTHVRKLFIFSQRGFACLCDRCRDNALDAELECIKCEGCHFSTLKPLRNLRSTRNLSHWIPSCETCGFITTPELFAENHKIYGYIANHVKYGALMKLNHNIRLGLCISFPTKAQLQGILTILLFLPPGSIFYANVIHYLFFTCFLGEIVKGRGVLAEFRLKYLKVIRKCLPTYWGETLLVAQLRTCHDLIRAKRFGLAEVILTEIEECVSRLYSEEESGQSFKSRIEFLRSSIRDQSSIALAVVPWEMNNLERIFKEHRMTPRMIEAFHKLFCKFDLTGMV